MILYDIKINNSEQQVTISLFDIVNAQVEKS
jgi:hypothetical protein